MTNRFRQISILLLFIFIAPSSLFSQTDKWVKNEKDKETSKKFSNNFYLSGGITPFLNFIKVDEKQSDNSIITKYDDAIVNLEIGARYNVFKFKDFFSVGVSTYPSIELGASTPGLSTIFKVPLGVDLNLFNSSTYNNISKLGLSIGAGRTFNFGLDGFNMQSTYIRPVIRYNKYVRKFNRKSKYTSKLKSGYFGIVWSFGNTLYQYNNYYTITGVNEFRIVLGRTFNH